MKRIALILFLSTLFAPALLAEDAEKGQAVWLQGLWKEHLEWRFDQPYDETLEAACRDMLRIDPFHEEALFGLQQVAQSNTVYALAGMLTTYRDFLHEDDPAYTSAWADVNVRIETWEPIGTNEVAATNILQAGARSHFDDLIDRADNALEEEAWEAAESTLRSLLYLHPTNHAVLVRLGGIYEATGEHAMSAMLHGYAHRYHRADLSFADGFANALARVGKTEHAFAMLKALIRKHPEEGRFQRSSSRLLVSAERYEEALTFLSNWISREPRNAEAWSAYADALIHTGKTQFAKVALNRVLQFAPKDTSALERHARLALGDENSDEVVAWLRKYRGLAGDAAFRDLMEHPPFDAYPDLLEEF